jgi:integrase
VGSPVRNGSGPIGLGVLSRTEVTAMPTIERRPRGDGSERYRARVRLHGAASVSETFPNKTEARRWAQKTEAAIREGRYFKHESARRHTLGEALDRYALEVLPRKPRTAKYQARQLAWWRQTLGHLRLVDLTASEIVTARTKLMREADARGRARGPATANRYMALLSHVLSVAMREWEWLDANPLSKIAKLREPRGREVFLSEADCSRLLSACATFHQYLHLVVLVALSTGMRRNEILTLRREQIDVDRGFIYLEDTKNGERRGAPLTGAALAAVSERLAGLPYGALLFVGKTGQTPFDIRKPWYGAIKAAGLRHIRFHDLRHTAASLLAKDGASLPVIGAVLGHKSPAMTQRYAHFAETHLHDVVASMTRRAFG